MSFLSELNSIMSGLSLPVETGVFSGKAPKEYVVITPLADTFALHAGDRPRQDTQEARLSLFSKENYTKHKNAIVNALLAADFTVTARQYIGYEPDSMYHHYCIDVAKNYELEGD
jgi:hypothetical protein